MKTREVVQMEAVQAAQSEDFNLAMVVAPRVGKSKIVLQAIGPKRFDSWNICIATPRETINEAWLLETEKWCPTLGIHIGVVPEPICFASLKKIDTEIDLLVLDECHMLSVPQMKTIKEKKPKRIWLLTGTANKYTRSVIKYQLGSEAEVKYEYPIEEAIRDGIIANFHAYIVKVELDKFRKNIKVGNKANTFFTTERKAYDFNSEMFDFYRDRERFDPNMKVVKEIYARKRANMLYNSELKRNLAAKIIHSISARVLAFTTRTEVADMLSPYSYHSKNRKENNLQRFIDEEINTLGVVNMSDMGVTIPNLKHIVVHQLQSNSELSLQKFLRACNLDEDKEASIIITVYKDTVDESWANQAIEGVPSDKVTWLEIEELEELMNKLR